MQFVDVTAGPVERLFGIATVRLHTAAAATDARLPGLGVSEAARLREQLTAARGGSRCRDLTQPCRRSAPPSRRILPPRFHPIDRPRVRLEGAGGGVCKAPANLANVFIRFSPVVRIGPSLLGILVVLGSAAALPGRTSSSASDLVIVAMVALGSVVYWAVTRWRVDGDTLRVETGLIRRQSLQVPLSSAQAIDLVEPFLARVLGLAEVRVRTGGASRGDARLCYLRYSDATHVRAGLLAVAHGLHEAVPAPPEERLVVVPTAGSSLLAA